MPPRVHASRGRFRRYIIAGLLLVVAAGAYAFVNVGRWLAAEDPLGKADAIFVLAGSLAERPLEAADLYHAGYAPRILLTRDTPEQAAAIANRRGAMVPGRDEIARDLLLRLGIPASALVIPSRQHDSTAEEARTLRDVAVSQGWKRIVVVSSKYHLRRVGLACRRQLRGTGVEIVLRASRYDRSMPEQWWSRRADIRWVVSELPKLLAYALGIGA